ncbi:MAG: hypothetical protein AAF125_23075 [Chloroflexota bacterium]
MFRFLQFIDVTLFFPIVIIGLMVGLSGGSSNPWLQKFGGTMLRYSPTGIVCAILAEFLWRFNLKPIAYVLVIVPIVLAAYFLTTLQRRTGFFFQKRR